MSDLPHELDISPRRPPIWARISVVWLVPVLALVVSLFVAWQSYSNRGIAITIIFNETAGIEAGKTVIKYRDVEIGLVERIGFTEDLSHVRVEGRVDKTVAPYLDDDARFWVARPRVTTRGISEIDTIVSGVYIEGTWDDQPETAVTEFTGLDEAPLVRPGAPGTQIRLRAPDAGSLAEGAPILFRGIEVGQIETLALAETGDSVTIEAFINAPHDRRLTTATRFWNVSGFTLSLDTTGVSLDVDSLASLVEGGLAFDTVYSGGQPVTPGQQFDIFTDEAAARESVFNQRLAAELRLSIEFDGSVQGLRAGAPVQFRGVRVGEVENLTVTVEEAPDGTPGDVRLLTNIIVNPGRLGLASDASREDALDYLEQAVGAGLRARIGTASILTGALLVELVELPEVLPASFDRDHVPHPQLPSVASEIGDFTATAEGVLERINALPVEELMTSAIDLMTSLQVLTTDASTQATPDAVLALIEDARRLVASEDLQRIAPDLRAVIADAAALVATVEEGEGAETLLATLAEAREALAEINTATDALPGLMTDLDALIDQAAALPLEGLIGDARATLGSANEILSGEDLKALPGSVRSLVAETEELVTSETVAETLTALQETTTRINGLLAEVEQAEAAAKLVATLERAQSAAANLDTASARLPGLTAELEELAREARALPLDELVETTRAFIETADGILESDATQALPGTLDATLNQLRGFVATLEEGDAAGNLNTALASAASASDAIAAAARDLPALAERLNRLAAQAGSTLGAYSGESEVNYQMRAALREIREAAEAVTSLSRAIERRPNSILIGR